ncbi:Calx-beta domain-containing protein [Paraburkholderia terrae]
MTFGVKERFYCVNVGKCKYARTDAVFTRDEYTRYQGLCNNPKGDGCGKPLRQGDSIDRRKLIVASVVLAAVVVVGIGASAVHALFPTPVAQVNFAQREVHTEERGGVVKITVSRSGDVKNAVVVKYKSHDGSAKGGENYEAVDGELAFEPGERNKTISITILPSRGYLKNDLYFDIALTNVIGAPKQVVFIEEPKPDATQQVQAERMVRATSVVATDIADLVVRERVTNDLLAINRSDSKVFHEYQAKLQTIQGNLRRSRESYQQAFQELQTVQARSVLQAMDTVSANLDHQGFTQQAKVTLIMKRQYAEFLSSHSLDMDRWSQELASAIPEIKPSRSKPST